MSCGRTGVPERWITAVEFLSLRTSSMEMSLPKSLWDFFALGTYGDIFARIPA
jgi:hypothetical protein